MVLPLTGSPQDAADALDRIRLIVGAAVDLLRSQTIVRKVAPLRGLSKDAGQILLDAGAVDTLDEGILVFHEEIAKTKPSVGKLLRDSDRRTGRLARIQRSRGQRAVTEAIRAGEFKRVNGRLSGLTPKGKRLVAEARKNGMRAELERKEKARKAASDRLKKLGAKQKRQRKVR